MGSSTTVGRQANVKNPTERWEARFRRIWGEGYGGRIRRKDTEEGYRGRIQRKDTEAFSEPRDKPRDKLDKMATERNPSPTVE